MGPMQHTIPHQRATEHLNVPDDAYMSVTVTDPEPGQVRVDLTMTGTGGKRVVLTMVGTAATVAADLDTMLPELLAARRVVSDRADLAEDAGGEW